MSDSPAARRTGKTRSPVTQAVEGVGTLADHQLRQGAGLIRGIGGMAHLFADTFACCLRGFFRPGVRLGRAALTTQMVRVGVESIGIVVIVEFFIGSTRRSRGRRPGSRGAPAPRRASGEAAKRAR